MNATEEKREMDNERENKKRGREGGRDWVGSKDRRVDSDPAETSAFFEPAKDKIYRHPTFYEIPDGVKNL